MNMTVPIEIELDKRPPRRRVKMPSTPSGRPRPTSGKPDVRRGINGPALAALLRKNPLHPGDAARLRNAISDGLTAVAG